MSKKNTKVKRIFALLMAVLIAVTYMPTSLYAYAEDYVDDDQVTAPSDEYVEETPQDAKTITLDGDLAIRDDSVRKALIETEAVAAAEDADTPVSDDTAVDTETDDTEEPSGETSEGTVEDGREPLDDKVDLTEVTTDTESQVVTKETETEAETISYPSHFFKEEAGGVKVAVSAPEGALPEGTTMEVTPILAEDVEEAVSEAVSDKVKSINAVDITFKNAEGQEIEPLIPVSVTLNVPGMNRKATKEIVHIDDEGTATTVDYLPVANTGASLFESDQFSVYVVVETEVPRLFVKFMNGDTEIATMIIKDADTAAEVDQIIYDPGAGTLASNEVFKGWSTTSTYSAEGLKTIDQVRTDAMALADTITADTSVTYYAAVFSQYKVVYEAHADVDDPNSDLVIVGTEVVETPKHNTSGAPYTVNMNYSTDDSHNFEGWLVADGLSNIASPTDVTASTLLQNGTALTIKGNIKLSVSAPQGHWLIFDENGKGATYNAPRFIKSGQVTSDEGLLEMVRNGYTFGGWYKDAACTAGNEFTFGGTISETTTIYAKWTAVSSANYTVIIWKQNLAANGYDFERSIPLSGTPGATINTVTQQGTGNNAYARVNGTNYQYTGFHLDHFDQNVQIKPEGNAVLNVYYNRTSYTLSFRRYENSGTVYKTITALYGQPIGSNFPISVNGDTTYRWEPHNSSTFNQVLVYIDIMPAENITFSRSSSDASTKYMEFYVEALPGQTPDRTWNGKSFVKYGNTIPAKYNFFTEAEDFLELTGYTKYGSDPAFSGGKAKVSSGGTIRFYYTRKSYALNFMDGAYYDGNGNRITTETSLGQLTTREGIAYGSSLTSYNKDGVNYVTPTGKEGYVFEGWYIDDACTSPYTFTTMSDGGITVYAKWRQIQFRVFLHPNAGTDPSLEWGSENQQMNFRINYDGQISAPTGTRNGYEFYGWYTNEACTQAFSQATRIRSGAPYNKNTDFTEGMDKWGNNATSNGDVDRFWITQKYELWAKWSAITVGANGIGVVYDDAEGTNAPTDTALYKDNTSVSAGAAPTPPEGKLFDHWVLQTWNGTEYVDTETTVLAGQTFTILKNDAKITDASTGAVVAPGAVVPTGHYNYTVQLKAVYRDKEEKTPTHIAWYSNYGSENGGKGTLYRYDTKDDQGNDILKINEAVDILGPQTRTGYVFKGWTKTQGGTTADFLVWDGSKYTTVDGTTATKVAADEKNPIEDLFAVWEAKLQVRIIGNTDSKVYNGSEQSVTGYTVEYKVGDGDWTTTVPSGVTVALASGAAAEAKGTNVGNYPMGLTKSSFTVTANGYTYDPATDLTVTDGNLEITPASVTLTAVSDTKTYNGSEQTITGYTCSVEGLTFTGVSASGSGTDAGTYPVTFTGVTLNETTDSTGNYVVTSVVPGTLTITPAAVTLTAVSDEKLFNGSNQTISGYTCSVEGLTFDGVSASGTGKNVGEYDVTFTGVTVNETTDSTGNYVVTSVVPGTLTITPIDVIVTVTGHTVTKTYNGADQQVTGYDVAFSGAGGRLYGEGQYTFSGTAVATGKNVNGGSNEDGSYPMGLTEGQFANIDDNFNVTFEVTDGWIKITPREVTVSVEDKTVEYNGSEQFGNSEYVFSNVVDGQTATITYTASHGTLVNTYDNGAYTAESFHVEDGEGNDVTSNYTLGTQTKGKLIITDRTDKYEINVVANSNTGNVYDGTEKSATGFVTLTFTVEGNTYTVSGLTTSNPASTNVCNLPNAISGTAVVTDANGNDVTSQFTVNTTDGSLEINKRQVSVSVDDITKKYNGSEQQGNTAYSFSNVVSGETATIGYTASHGTLVNTYDNGSYAEDFKVVNAAGTDVTNNYELTDKTPGKLTITDRDVKYEITVKANSNIGNVYDRQSHAATGFETLTFNIDGNNYTVEGLTTSDPSSVNVCDIPNTITGTAIVKDAAGNDVTAQFDVSTVDGRLEILPAEIEITVTGNNVTDTYDGNNHVAMGYTATANNTLYDTSNVKMYLFGNYTTEVVPTAERTVVGQTMMGIREEAVLNGNPGYVPRSIDPNFTVTKWHITDGYVRIMARAVTVSVPDKTVEYNGSEQFGNTGYTFTNVAAGQTATITYTPSSGTLVGTYDNGAYAADFKVVDGSGNNVTYNYDLTRETTGKLYITDRTNKYEITVVANSNTGNVYDGTEKTATGFVTLEFEVGGNTYTVEGLTTSNPASTNVCDLTNAISGTAVVKDAAGNDVTSQFTVNTTDGRLEITPKAVTITARDASRPYDGDPLTQPLFDTTPLASTDNHVFTVVMTDDSTITDVGTQPNVIATVDGVEVVTGEQKAIGNYLVTTAEGELEITQDKTAIVITSATNQWTYDSKTHTDETYTVTYGGATVEAGALGKEFTLPNGDVLKIISTAAGVKNVSDNANNNNTYTYTITRGTADTTGNYESITANVGTLTINPKTVTITAEDANKPYDGTPLTQPLFNVTDLEEGDEHVFTVVMTDDSTITDVGTQPNVIATVDGVEVVTGEQKAIGNYLVTTAEGELEITQDKTAIVITSATNQWTYDSKTHTDETYTVTYGGQTVTAGEDGKTFTLPNGDVLTITATAAGVTNVSDNANNNNTYTYTVTRGTVDTLGNYESITANVGTLTVNPKTVTITANDADKAYDGQPLTEGGFTNTPLETGDDHVFVVTMTADSTITDVGTQPNVIATVDGVAVTTGQATAVGNYLVTTAEGTLTITQDEAEFVIKSADHTWTYDSKLHKDETYTVTYKGTEVAAGTDGKTFTLPNGDVLTITATAAGVTNVSDNAADNNTFTYVVKRGDVVTTGNYKNVVINIGDLVIAPKEVTITANDADKPYDGTPLTEGGYSNTPLEEGDEHVFAVTMTADSTITDVGTQPNVIATVDGVAVTTGQQTAIGNYLVTTVNGTLEITKDQAEIVISSASNEWTYDGENHTDETYTVTYNGEVIEPEEDGVTFILPNGDVIVITPTAEGVTDVADNAEDNNTFTYTVMRGDVDTSGNYENLTADPGTLTIDPRPVTVIADDKTKVYGTADPELTATEDGVVEGDTLEYELYRDRGENVGSYNISFTYPTDNEPQPAGWFQKLFRAFEPQTQTVVQGNYEIKFVDGEFDITPMPLTITAASDEKVYDGTPLTNSNYTYTELAEGDTLVSVTVTGSQTEVGSSPNIPSDAKITNAAGEDMTGNYDITYVKGALVVTPAPVDPPKPPKTGDDNHPWGWAGLAGLAMAGLAVLFATRKREEESR